jgi:hypothetical protein
VVNYTDFLNEMEDILELPAAELNGATRLADCVAWDSLAMLAFTVFAGESASRTVTSDDLRSADTVDDLYHLLSGAEAPAGRL